MPTTKAQQKAVAKYVKNNYDEIKVRVPKGEKKRIEEHANSKGMTVNALMNELIRKEIGTEA